jgi:hypothetical protein
MKVWAKKERQKQGTPPSISFFPTCPSVRRFGVVVSRRLEEALLELVAASSSECVAAQRSCVRVFDSAFVLIPVSSSMIIAFLEP